MKIKIVGFDPSLSNWGIVKATLDIESLDFTIDDLILVDTEGSKAKQVRKNSDDMERARLLSAGMHSACKGASLAIAEVPVGSQSARAMASYGICLGVLAACPIPLIQVNPTEVKLAAVGIKTATKEEMIEWATTKFPKAPWLTVKRAGIMVATKANEHLADAVGTIFAAFKTDQFKQAIALYKGMLVS